MTYDIKKVAEWMVEQGYFIVHKGNYVVSAKFNTEVRGQAVGLQKLPGGKLKVLELDKPAPGLSPEEWRDMYMKFITDCEIPRYCANGKGDLYEVNKFSLAALKVFQKMLSEEKIDLARLTAVTKLYYSNARRMPLAISNYITTGAWRSDYAVTPDIQDTGSAYKLD